MLIWEWFFVEQNLKSKFKKIGKKWCLWLKNKIFIIPFMKMYVTFWFRFFFQVKHDNVRVSVYCVYIILCLHPCHYTIFNNLMRYITSKESIISIHYSCIIISLWVGGRRSDVLVERQVHVSEMFSVTKRIDCVLRACK